MAVLTRADIMAALKIRKLLAHADNPGATLPERRSYAAKAARLASRYRYGDRMMEGRPDEAEQRIHP